MAASISHWVDLLLNTSLNAMQSIFCIAASILNWVDLLLSALQSPFLYWVDFLLMTLLSLFFFRRILWKHTKPQWSITFVILENETDECTQLYPSSLICQEGSAHCARPFYENFVQRSVRMSSISLDLLFPSMMENANHCMLQTSVFHACYQPRNAIQCDL